MLVSPHDQVEEAFDEVLGNEVGPVVGGTVLV